MKHLTHAGGIVFRGSAQEALFLIVQSSRAADRWVLPKGHVEPGEAPEETAVREVCEEAGVDAEVIALAGEHPLRGPNGPGRVRFYLMRYRASVPAAECREIAWVPYDEARERLSFDDQRRLLARGWKLLIRGKPTRPA